MHCSMICVVVSEESRGLAVICKHAVHGSRADKKLTGAPSANGERVKATWA